MILKDRPIDHRYVSRLVKTFQETLSIKGRFRSGRPTVEEDSEIEILIHVNTDSQEPLAQISRLSTVLSPTIRKKLENITSIPTNYNSHQNWH